MMTQETFFFDQIKFKMVNEIPKVFPALHGITLLVVELEYIKETN